jgi:hypothetical protein
MKQGLDTLIFVVASKYLKNSPFIWRHLSERPCQLPYALVINEEPWLNKCHKISPEISQNVPKIEPTLGNDMINLFTQFKLKLLNATPFGSYFHGQYQIFDQ